MPPSVITMDSPEVVTQYKFHLVDFSIFLVVVFVFVKYVLPMIERVITALALKHTEPIKNVVKELKGKKE